MENLEEEKVIKKKFDHEAYLAVFMRKNSLKNQAWIIQHRKNSDIQRNYFLAKKIEYAEGKLLHEQTEIVQSFRKFMEDLMVLKDHYSENNFWQIKLEVKEEFERRMSFAKRIWYNYVEECKKNQK